ncbi:hypothetical protein [Streptomyces noursei]|uniref:hypothetical protein n=1 Tax=Streptomyces noursei TaxID=1971 RepID=UPI001F0351D4|nr:hypothetical protein [Streptomyces noursei]
MFRDAEVTRLTGSHGDEEPDEARIRDGYATRVDAEVMSILAPESFQHRGRPERAAAAR